MRSKTILITGGAGFIGSHLCHNLLENGDKVICMDNLFTGSIENIFEFQYNPNFEFINHDIIKPFYYEKHIDEIYNLACPASPIQYKKNPIKTIKTCTAGVINILGLARRHDATILQASTSEIYGDPNVHPQTEEYFGNVNPIGPRSCYDEGKRCSETLFMDYYREHKLKIKIVRIFNTYGPKMAVNDGRVVSNFINQAINNKSITIKGDGCQTRSFQYIDDLIDALIKIMESRNGFTGPVNIGNPNEIPINILASKILKLTKSKSKVVHEDLPKDDPKRRKPDISLANKELHWKPKISIDIGLKKTINYFKKLNEKKN